MGAGANTGGYLSLTYLPPSPHFSIGNPSSEKNETLAEQKIVLSAIAVRLQFDCSSN